MGTAARPEPSADPADTSPRQASVPVEETAQQGADGVPHAVNLGYRVIEDYLRQGQQTAEQLVGGEGGFGAGGSFQALSGRLIRDGFVWLEHLAKIWATFDPPGGSPSEQAGVASAGSALGFRVRVASREPAEVSIDLRPQNEARPLAVYDLRSPDSNAQAIVGVELARSDPSGCWEVSVRVPDDQPPGLYSAVVYDRRDGTIQGTLSVHVAPNERAP